LPTVTAPGAKDSAKHRRPFHQTLTNAVHGLAVILVLIPMVYCQVISIIIRVIIEVRIAHNGTEVTHWPLRTAAIVAFALDASMVCALFVPPPLPQALLIADRRQAVGTLSGFEISYVVLSLLGNLWTITIIFRFGAAVLRSMIYRAWLDSFSPDWPNESNWFWTTYFWAARWSKTFLE
jgi:isoprenylcysteine carboxyl methyltransferase (ICMT) family protein YpbQ